VRKKILLSHDTGDLAQRHRRHCNPKRTVSKRKSCDACVQARTKCCLSQPTCSRCSERGLVCEYAAPPKRLSPSQSSGSITTGLAHNGNFYDPSVILDLDMSMDNVDWTAAMSNPSWTPQVDNWPPVQLGQSDSYFDSGASSTAQFSATENVQNHTGQTTPSEWLVQQWNATLPTPPAQTIVTTNPTLSALPLSATDGSSDKSSDLPTPSLNVAEILRILRTYPLCFSSDDYHTPLPHRELYGTPVGAITTLPKSTTAIMCALGLNESSNKSFLRGAMTVERQRLVEGFVSDFEP
jgi:hypothetical protein